MHGPGKLFLIPAPISENLSVIPPQVIHEIKEIRYFLAENMRTARRYLRDLKIFESIEAIHFEEFNKNTSPESLPSLLSPLQHGNNMGILSESGCPGIADPGALAVAYAHQNNISVFPLVGPSSIILALMASGLNGQCFAFHGYLPIKSPQRIKAIKKLEKESQKNRQTQIFIETPYRNQNLLKDLVHHLHPHTALCIAQDLTGEKEEIRTFPIEKWKGQNVQLAKVPSIFLFQVL